MQGEYPKHLRPLLELSKKDVEGPSYVWLAYAVCAVSKNACGWQGWIIDGVFKKTKEKYPTGTGDKALVAADKQECPICSSELFRTGVDARFGISKNQSPVHGVSGKDYEVAPIEFDD